MASKKSIVALNLGSQRVSMGLFSSGGKGSLVLRRLESADLLADPQADATRAAQVRSAVEELAGKLRVKGQSARYAIAGRTAIMKFAKIPPLDVDQVEDIVKFEAQQNVPFPLDECAWDYQLIGQPGGEMEAAIVAVKSDTIDELDDAVSASLRSDGADISPAALYNAFRYNYSDLEEPALLIDIGARSTNLIYIDGDHVFARNSTQVGGGTITQAIAKEFDAEFAVAEDNKVANGLVSLGGAYADPEDPAIAEMSKVIRNTLTRLHAEIVRTTNQYKGQQGGSAPQRVFLAGGTAGLGYIKEFFEEKLKLPVEFFNPLRNVQIGPNADTETLAREAHRLGEVVGVALHAAGIGAMDIDLVPASVARRRDVQRRRPYLMMAAAVAFAALLAGIFHYTRKATITRQATAELEEVERELGRWDRQITDVREELDADQARSRALENAVVERTYWLELLNDLNNRLPNDMVWITAVDPVAGEKSLSGKQIAVAEEAPATSGGGGAPGAEAPPEDAVHTLHLVGLYRSEAGGAQAVSDYLDAIAESPFFDVGELETNRSRYMPLLERGRGDRWAYPFEFVLPMKRAIKIN